LARAVSRTVLGVLRLPDPLSGVLGDLVPHTPGLLTVLVEGADLKTAVLADVVVRTGRMHGLRVRHVHMLPDPSSLADALSQLNVQPAHAVVPTYAEAVVELARPVDVLVTAGSPAPRALPARGPGARELRAPGAPLLLADLSLDGLDPLAARLALLEGLAPDLLAAGPTGLSRSDLEQCDVALTQWRWQVCAWAEAPSGALSEQVQAEVLEAYDRVDPGRAIAALHRMASDPATSDGTRWETAAWADRLLGLDLARLVGQPARAAPGSPPPGSPSPPIKAIGPGSRG